MPHVARRPVEDEEPRLVAALGGTLRDQLGRQLVVELCDVHPSGHVSLGLDGSRRGRAGSQAPRRGEGRANRPRRGRRRRWSARARGSRSSRPPQPSSRRACRRRSAQPSRTGIAGETRPVARQLAEVRGLMNQVLRRLERLEGDCSPSATPGSTTSACSWTSSRRAGAPSTSGSRSSSSTFAPAAARSSTGSRTGSTSAARASGS